jgi:hypothetical protein
MAIFFPIRLGNNKPPSLIHIQQLSVQLMCGVIGEGIEDMVEFPVLEQQQPPRLRRRQSAQRVKLVVQPARLGPGPGGYLVHLAHQLAVPVQLSGCSGRSAAAGRACTRAATSAHSQAGPGSRLPHQLPRDETQLFVMQG